jgi:hypothetical protein
VDLDQTRLLGVADLEAEGVAIECSGGRDVLYREARRQFEVLEHG